MRYETFNLQIRKGPEGLAVLVDSPAGQGEGRLDLELVRTVRQRPAASQGTCTLEDTGRNLFDALLDDKVAVLFYESLALLGPSRGLRIQLRLDLSDPSIASLAELPWECLYSGRLGGFLGLRRRTPIVRSVAIPRPAQSLPAPRVLRALVVLANPSNAPELDLATERAAIEAALQGTSNVEIDVLEQPTRETLAAALAGAARAGRPHHVLHFMGHGSVDAATGDGLLWFVGESGRADPIRGEELVRELADFPALRLVFLNACQSARSASEESPFRGVAAGLVRAGVPAVVAMQMPVSDKAAVELCRVFYRRLAAGDPLDTAITEGRLALDRLRGADEEWSVPVLFLRLPDGYLFTSADALPHRSFGLRRAGLAVLAAVLTLLLGLGWARDRREAGARQRIHRGLALMSEGRSDEARHELLAVLKTDPENSAAHANLSILEENQGRYGEALEHARSAAAAAPAQAVHHYNLGNLLAFLGRDEEALSSLHRAVVLDPGHAPAWNELGRLYLRLDRPVEAKQALEAGLRSDPNLAPLHKNFALVDLSEDRAVVAIARLERALSLYAPDDTQGIAETLYRLTEANVRAGRREAACHSLESLARRPAGPWMQAGVDLAKQIRCEGVS
ncbi:MAG TPA: CHAT domain-containing protein [Thermoanaerobaculia bacterium]|nr:CHAT domain-containing protein [Thermoanaerobaculia bacterium]